MLPSRCANQPFRKKDVYFRDCIEFHIDGVYQVKRLFWGGGYAGGKKIEGQRVQYLTMNQPWYKPWYKVPSLCVSEVKDCEE